jgi:acyl-CoA synthetase (AMP-forming)/AMP-acid ligase II
VFFDLNSYSQHVALTEVVDSASDPSELVVTSINYQQLQQKVELTCQSLMEKFELDIGQGRFLVVLKMYTNVTSVVSYLALLQLRILVIVVDPDIKSDSLKKISKTFGVNAVCDNSNISFIHFQPNQIASNAAILLSTSGTTGNPKFVALSYENLQANAESICTYLPIEQKDIAMNTLPLFYSYGLSVLNTHLFAGASIVLSDYSVMNKQFWSTVKNFGISSLAGVPHTYEMLLKLRFDNMDLPSLKYFTQAGGKMNEENLARLADYAERSQKKFYVMYGQTEATARMSFYEAKSDSICEGKIGKVIPNGKFKVIDNELYYKGPNVMLGYVQNIKELMGFSNQDWLATGDIVKRDSKGDYLIIGRKKRFVKILGFRTDLDSVESLLQDKNLRAYCCGTDKKLLVAIEASSEKVFLEYKVLALDIVKQHFKIHHTSVQFAHFNKLPLTANGKKDYPSVMRNMEKLTNNGVQ